jgi:hypothetical protein
MIKMISLRLTLQLVSSLIFIPTALASGPSLTLNQFPRNVFTTAVTSTSRGTFIFVAGTAYASFDNIDVPEGEQGNDTHAI